MGDAQRNVSRKKQLGRRRKGYRKFPPLSSLFFFPPLFFSLHLPLPKCLEQARDLKGLHLFVESTVGVGDSPVKGRVEEVTGPLREQSSRGRSFS